MNFYVVDDFNEPLRYFDTYLAALNYCHDSSRIMMIDLYETLGGGLL